MTDTTLPLLSPTTDPADSSIYIVRRDAQLQDESVLGSVLKTYMNTSPSISGGTIDNAVIGATTPAAASFTTLTSNTIDTGQGAVECYAMDQAVQSTDSVAFSSLALTTDLAVIHGGTGASNAADARTNLGIVIGSDVQPYDAGLASIAGLTTAANTGIYTTALDTYSTYSLTAAGRALAGTSGAIDTFPYFSALDTVSSATITAVGRGLLSDSTSEEQRATLGLIIGSDVQAYDEGLTSIAGLTTLGNEIIYTTATNTYSTSPVTTFGLNVLTINNAAEARAALGLGTIATQNASNVTITGGDISGITDLAVLDGGTGASTPAGARSNLGLGTLATQDATNVNISGGAISGIADLAIADGGTGASTAVGARTNLDVYSTSQVDALIPSGSGSLVFIGEVNATNVLTVEFLNLTSTYDHYIIEGFNILTTFNGANLRSRVSSNNGTSYDSGSGDYQFASIERSSNSSGQTLLNDLAIDYIQFNGFTTLNSNATLGTGTCLINLLQPSVAKYTFISSEFNFFNNVFGISQNKQVAARSSNDVINAVQLYLDNGLLSGDFRLYGVKTS